MVAGIKVGLTIRCELLHFFQIALYHRRHGFGAQHAIQSIDEFTVFKSPVAAQVIKTCTGMRIDDPVRIVLAVVVIQDMDEYGVLQNIGVVAGVKGVSIAEQEDSLWAGAAVYKFGKYGGGRVIVSLGSG